MGATASIQAECVFDPSIFPKDGVKLSFIEEFFTACGGRDKLEDLTTTEVCQQYIKPLTNHTQSSFCESLKLGSHAAVGRATVFISHAWKYKFLDVVAALQSHFEDEPDVIIWFDLFSNNQHQATQLPYEWWCTTFKSAIGDMKRMVMVLSPFSNPIPYTRAWCIFESYCCADTGSVFEIATSAEDEANFIRDAECDVSNTINSMLVLINAENSECYLEEDKEKIFTAIRETVGFHHINSMVFEQLRGWVIKTGERALSDNTDKARRPSLLAMLANLYGGQGNYAKAEPLLEECWDLKKAALGDKHMETMGVVSNLASLYQAQGKYTKAEPLFKECVEVTREVLGESHVIAVQCLINFAGMYQKQGKYSLAEPLYGKCLDVIKAEASETHEMYLLCLHDLALLYQAQGEYAKAEPHLLKCLSMRKEALGDKHPETLYVLGNLALLYLSRLLEGRISEYRVSEQAQGNAG